MVTGAAVLLASILAYTAAAIWPNSGDEYGYLYLADTLLRGRFYNPAPPAPGLFDFFGSGCTTARVQVNIHLAGRLF